MTFICKLVVDFDLFLNIDNMAYSEFLVDRVGQKSTGIQSIDR